MRVYEKKDRGVARPQYRKPEPEPVQSVERDRDGFDLYVCSECGEKKIAAVFNPGQITSSELRCMACTGEAFRHPVSGPRPPCAPQQRPRFFVEPHWAPMPLAIRRGGGLPRI